MAKLSLWRAQARKYRVSIILTAAVCLLLVEFRHFRNRQVMITNEGDPPTHSNFTEFGEILMDLYDESMKLTWLSVFVYVDMSSPDMVQYNQSLSTVICYCRLHSISLVVIDHHKVSSTHLKKCKQHQMLLFRKHCVTASLLAHHPSVHWISVIDADTGVINPKQTLQKFIGTKSHPIDQYDLIFYERFFDWEIASGNYLARNTKYAQQFLQSWANYEFKLPVGKSSYDNGALQILLLKTLNPDANVEQKTCERIWYNALNWPAYHHMVACVKAALGARRHWPHIWLVRRAHGWVIDRDITRDRWTDNMFMIHGWKRAQIKTSGGWPLTRAPTGDECDASSFTEWPYTPFRKITIPEMKKFLSDEEQSKQGVFLRPATWLVEPDVAHCWPDCETYNATNEMFR